MFYTPTAKHTQNAIRILRVFKVNINPTKFLQRFTLDFTHSRYLFERSRFNC